MVAADAPDAALELPAGTQEPEPPDAGLRAGTDDSQCRMRRRAMGGGGGSRGGGGVGTALNFCFCYAGQQLPASSSRRAAGLVGSLARLVLAGRSARPSAGELGAAQTPGVEI